LGCASYLRVSNHPQFRFTNGVAEPLTDRS
jgi:hypothetical protein